jgi:hypothetical protein
LLGDGRHSVRAVHDHPSKGTRLAAELPQIGEKVAAFGNPIGFSFTTSEGIISAIRSGQELREIVGRARELFVEGLPLSTMVDRRLAIDLDLFSRGGMRVLHGPVNVGNQPWTLSRAEPTSRSSERV